MRVPRPLSFPKIISCGDENAASEVILNYWQIWWAREMSQHLARSIPYEKVRPNKAL
jgi:hypothetical protein